MKKRFLFIILLIIPQFSIFTMEIQLIYQNKLTTNNSEGRIYINSSPFFLNNDNLLLYNEKKIYLYNIPESKNQVVDITLLADLCSIISIDKTFNDNEVIISYLNTDRKEITKKIFFDSNSLVICNVSDIVNDEVCKNTTKLNNQYSLIVYSDENTDSYTIDAYLGAPAYKCGIKDTLSNLSGKNYFSTLTAQNGKPVYILYDYCKPYVDTYRKKIIIATDLTQPNEFSFSSVDDLQLYIYEWN